MLFFGPEKFNVALHQCGNTMRLPILRRAVFAIGLLGMLGALAGTAAAQSNAWPQRTVKLIVPLSPGTATDVTARLYADRLSQRWGKPVVVENRPGPDGLAAVTAFVGARDDHTLLFSFGGPVTVNPVLHEKLPYEPGRDLVPIISASDSFLAIAAAASLNITSLADLAKRARAEPGKLNWAATPGMPQFALTGFINGAKLDMVQVAYRDFTPALQDLSEGRISVAATGLLPLMPLGQAGKAKILAVTSRQRSAAAPDVLTVVEAGFPDAVAEGFQGFFGWRDMPNALRDQIAADVRAIAPSMPADRLIALGQVVRVGSTADFAAMLAEQHNRVKAIVQATAAKSKQ
jgi:tripartite-type tricarboxylate transporter receptor subunit TctC